MILRTVVATPVVTVSNKSCCRTISNCELRQLKGTHVLSILVIFLMLCFSHLLDVIVAACDHRHLIIVNIIVVVTAVIENCLLPVAAVTGAMATGLAAETITTLTTTTTPVHLLHTITLEKAGTHHDYLNQKSTWKRQRN